MKKGFTLAELLVTLGTIGVLAAITAPMITGLMPDKNKMMVIKAYKTLSDINQELLDDPSIYFSDGNCVGFDCINEHYIEEYKDVEVSTAIEKYRGLLKLKMHTDDSSSTDYDFETSDGIAWKIGKDEDENEDEDFKVTIHDAEEETLCMYGNSGCSKPNQFKFSVNPASGKVTGEDNLTKAYLKNPHKLNDRKNDYLEASSIKN